jgi:hypothetical protein
MDAMLTNCKRFLANRCEGGGPWKSYAALEEELKAQKETTDKLLEASTHAGFQFVEVPGGYTCIPQAPQVLLSANDSITKLVRNLLNDVADKHKIYKTEQFECPHMRALATAVFPDGEIIIKDYCTGKLAEQK